MFWSFPGSVVDVESLSAEGGVSREAEVRHKRRQKQAVITRRFSSMGLAASPS